ncbi:MAG: molybdenum cofactor guanylyltransferase [Terriglobia bacterium]
MPDRFREITGFVLAGGASRRMGRPKQELLIHGMPLLAWQVQRLASVCGSVAIVGSSSRPIDGAASYPDEQAGLGPLGGIYTGLALTRTEYNLFVGCDMPFVTRAFLRFLCRCSQARRADVVVPESSDRRLQPLSAVYRRCARDVIRASLDAGLNKTSGFYARVRCAVIPWPEIYRAGFLTRTFINLNTPEDYEAVNRAL